MNYTIKNEYYTVTVSDTGAEIVSIKSSSGAELIWQTPNENFWSKHAPLLFPICGRIKDKKYTYGGVTYNMNAHGFIGTKTFELIEKSESKLVLSSTADDETRSVYPFDYSFTAEYELIGDSIKCAVTVKNNGEKTMPYMFGWHPGFTLPCGEGLDIEDYTLKFDGIDRASWIKLQNGPFACPNGVDFPLKDGKYPLCEREIYENDTMIFTEVPPRVTLSADGHPYSLLMEWSANTPYFCVWKEPNSTAKFICLEPWSGTPNDGETEENFEVRKMARLAPGAQEVYTLSFKFTV